MEKNIQRLKIISIFWGSLFFCIVHSAFAGPLRDKIMERRLAQQQEEMLDAADSTNSNTALPPGVKLVKDFPFGSDARQRMDIYLPPGATDAPVVLMVHGGGWRLGDKAMSNVVRNKVARWVPKGIIFISINYRMLPSHDPLQQSEDVMRALATAQSHAQQWGGDPSRFILMGHSAGAHLVSLVSAEPSKAIKLGAKPWLGTVSLDSAALDVVQIMERKHYRFYDQAFGSDSSYWKSVSPIHRLMAGAKPIMAVCSSTRTDNPCLQAHGFADKAASLGIRVAVLEQALTHKQINQDLGLPGAYTDAVEAFMSSLDGTVKNMLMNVRP
ncbi:MAG: alpha/beta hydrolase [Burkholderiaceae bacterium]